MTAADVLTEAPDGYAPTVRLKWFTQSGGAIDDDKTVLAQLWSSRIVDQPNVWVAVPREEVA